MDMLDVSRYEPVPLWRGFSLNQAGSTLFGLSIITITIVIVIISGLQTDHQRDQNPGRNPQRHPSVCQVQAHISLGESLATKRRVDLVHLLPHSEEKLVFSCCTRWVCVPPLERVVISLLGQSNNARGPPINDVLDALQYKEE
jgi:hypothetical protein